MAETERKMSQILKSGGRVAESKVYRPKNRIGGWQTAESVSQKLKFHGSQKFKFFSLTLWVADNIIWKPEIWIFPLMVAGGRRQSLTSKNFIFFHWWWRVADGKVWQPKNSIFFHWCWWLADNRVWKPEIEIFHIWWQVADNKVWEPKI